MQNEEENADIYKVTRAQIEHLDNTLSQRIVWLVLSQSFFVSGYAILITGNPNDPHSVSMQHILLILFPIISMIMVLFSFFDIVAGAIYIKRLSAFFKRQLQENHASIHYPPLAGEKMLNQFKNLSTYTVPFVFIVFWIYVLLS
jgi:hypothetical protein